MLGEGGPDGVAVELSEVAAAILAFLGDNQEASELNHLTFQMLQHFHLLMEEVGSQRMGQQWSFLR